MGELLQTFLDELQYNKKFIEATRPYIGIDQCRKEAMRQTTVHKQALGMFMSLKSHKFDRCVIFLQEMPPSYCFRIKFNVEGIDNYRFDGVSISSPPGTPPNCFETALFLGDELTYVEDIGYKDVVGFYGDNNADIVDQIVEEINRLVDILNNQ